MTVHPISSCSPTIRRWCAAGFRALLDAQPDIVVVGEAADGDEAVRLAVEHRPDVVLMDIRMPGTDGLVGDTADRRRRARWPTCG